MSKTYTFDSSTSRAHPTPTPARRLMPPQIAARKGAEPVVVLTAYTARFAQLLDQSCDMLLVGDSLGQVIYGLDSTLPVTMEMMINHGAAVVRGSMQACVAIDMPFSSYEESPAQAYRNASRLLAETGAQAVKLEGGAVMAETVKFLVERGIPVIGHVGLTPQSINALGGYAARGSEKAEYARILADAKAIAQAGAFAIVLEGVIEPLAAEITKAVPAVTIGIGASATCDGQVLVTEDMLGLFERTPRFVRQFGNLAQDIAKAAADYAQAVRGRRFPGPEQVYGPKKSS